MPEGGDGIQIMKAGLNEIADIFVVNKADRDGADRVKAELELNVHLRPAGGWQSAGAADAGRQRPRNRIAGAATGPPSGISSQPRSIPRIERQQRAHEFLEILTGQIEERAKRALGNGPAHELLDAVCAGQSQSLLGGPHAARRPFRDGRIAQQEPGRLLTMAAWKKHGRLFAIGDIHGCPDELGALLKAIDLGSERHRSSSSAITSTAVPPPGT